MTTIPPTRRVSPGNISFVVQSGGLVLLGTLLLAVYKDAQISLELARVQAEELLALRGAVSELRAAMGDRYTATDQARYERAHNAMHELEDARLDQLEEAVRDLKRGGG